MTVESFHDRSKDEGLWHHFSSYDFVVNMCCCWYCLSILVIVVVVVVVVVVVPSFE